MKSIHPFSILHSRSQGLLGPIPAAIGQRQGPTWTNLATSKINNRLHSHLLCNTPHMHVFGRWEEARVPTQKGPGPADRTLLLWDGSAVLLSEGVHNLTCAKRENTEKETKAIIQYVQFDCVYPRKKIFWLLAVCTIQLYTVLFCGFQTQKQSYFSARRQLIGSQNG